MKQIVLRAKELIDEQYISLDNAFVIATYQCCGTLVPLKTLYTYVDMALYKWQYKDLYQFDCFIRQSNTQESFLNEMLSYILYPEKISGVVREFKREAVSVTT